VVAAARNRRFSRLVERAISQGRCIARLTVAEGRGFESRPRVKVTAELSAALHRDLKVHSEVLDCETGQAVKRVPEVARACLAAERVAALALREGKQQIIFVPDQRDRRSLGIDTVSAATRNLPAPLKR
jgi:hypothetical protein